MHEGDSLRVVTDLLDIGLHLLADLLKAGATVGWLCDVQLVDHHDELLHAQHVGQQYCSWLCPFLEMPASKSLHHLPQSAQHSRPGPRDRERKAQLRSGLGCPLATPRAGPRPPWWHLRGACDHVLDEAAVTRGVYDGDIVLLGLELPQGGVDGDASFPLCLQLVQHPGILEGAFAHLSQEWEEKPQGHPYFQSCPSAKMEVKSQKDSNRAAYRDVFEFFKL